MSTKTTFKRVALVAVASLGFGVLSSVAPASAAESDAAEITAVAITAPGTGRVGSAFTSALSFTALASDIGDEVTLRGRFDSKPTGATAVLAFNNVGLAVAGPGDETAVYTASGAAGNELYPAKLVVDSTTTAITDATHVAGKVGFIPDALGSYVVTVWHDADNDGLLDSGESTDTETFTVAAGATTITATRINSVTAEDGTVGSLVKLAITTAAGTAAGLAANESISLDPSGTGDIAEVNGADVTSTAGAAYSLVAADFIGGTAWINIIDAEIETVTVAITGVGGDIASLTGTFSVQFVDTDTAMTATTAVGATGVKIYGATYVSNGESDTATAGAAGPDYIVPLGASSVTFTTTATAGVVADAYMEAKITDADGRVTGSSTQSITGLEYDAVATFGTALTAAITVAMTSTTVGQNYVVDTNHGGTDIVSEVTADIIDLDGGTVTVSPADAITAALGSTLTYSVLVKDQFGRALTTGTVAMSIAGRNATTASTIQTKSLDSTGRASFTITDAPAAGVTATSDTVTFTAADANAQDLTATASITWAAQTVGTIVLTGGNTTAGVTAATVTNKDISAADGAEAGVQTFSATVKDASGNLLAGTPVTWTITGPGAAVLSTKVTSYSSAAGVATTSVYGWIAGTYTVTATAGGKTGTGTITFAQTGTGEERTISATVEGSVVSAKVVDRFGNPVSGVTVYATKSGVGYFGAGVTKTSTTTNAAGIAEFVIAGGSASVTVSTISYDAVAGTKGSGQTSSLKGYSDSATTPTAFTAYTAGTATVAEAGVGASYDAAGVSSAGVEVSVIAADAAADAAAEATDAANAATDAANAAAEAADAATAAAQDAADAVAALSTQVSEMVNALKKQITALTNLVIKIQKKVKA